jgi:bla regulator protein blaR1
MTWLLAIGLKNVLLALPLAALALAAGRWWKRPALAHLLWALVLVKLIMPPVIGAPVGWRLDIESWFGAAEADKTMVAVSQRADGKEPAPTFQQADVPPPVVTRLRTRHIERLSATPPPREPAPLRASWNWLASLESWMQMAAALWVTGSALVLAIFLFSGWRFRRFVRHAAVREHELAIRVAELSADTGLGVPPRVVVVEGIVSPMLWGLGGNVRIVFPRRLTERLSRSELDSLLLHELAHYARGDCWIRALEMAAIALYWWNPLVWLALREIEAAEEECCDAWVIRRQQGKRHCYAEALLATVDFLCERPIPSPPAACGLGEVALIKARLTQIIHGEAAPRLSRPVQILVLMLGVAISPLEPALWATSTPSSASPSFEPEEHAAAASDAAVDRELKTASLSPEAVLAPPEPSSSAPSRIAAQFAPLAPLPNLWATAVSPNRQFRLEARTGRRITLAGTRSDYRLDLSSHRITCAAFAPSSTVFATGHEDALVRLWDSETGGLIRSLPGCEAAITSLDISRDGRQVAAGDQDGLVLVWDLAEGSETARLELHETPVSCLRWSDGGERVAVTHGAWSDASLASLAIWSPAEHAIVLESPLAEPVGAVEWLEGDASLLIAAWSGRAEIWETASGRPLWPAQVEKNLISAAAWSPDCPLAIEWLDSPGR